jgi:hypothetical protein
MASITLQGMIPRFGSGTTVGAYLKSQWPHSQLSGAPEGAAVTTAAVQTDSSLTFSGLTAETEYIAYVGTPDRYTSFLVPAGGLSPNARDVELIEPIPSGTNSIGGVTATNVLKPAGAPTTATSVAATSTSAALLASNGAATYRQIVNVGTDTVTVKLGSGTVVDYQGITMPPNSSWDGWIGDRFYTGALAVKTLTTTATVSVVEG